MGATQTTCSNTYETTDCFATHRFRFGGYARTGGDGAIDALGNPTQTIGGWPDYYNSGANVLSYAIPVVPEPTMGALLGLGGLMVVRRYARRNS